MKNIPYNNRSRNLVLGLLLAVVSFASCENEKQDAPLTIAKIFLEDAQSSVPDREVTFARLGQIIRLQGSGFVGVTKAFVNGKSCYFNPVFISDNSMMIQISADVPVMDAPDNVRNTIQLVKTESNRLVYPFEIRAAAPVVTRISHTMPQAGEEIVIYGTGLHEAKQVTFPGGKEGTNISSDDEKGTWVKVTVPAGIAESGSVTVVGANGGAYSPAYFNYKEGLVHNFDNVQNYSWGSGIDNTALTATIPASGNLPKSQGGYQAFNAGGNLAASGDQRFWLNSNAIFSNITDKIPASASADQCGIQMDIYVEGAWNSGIIRFVMADGSGASRYCMLYQPVYMNGAYSAAAFENPGCWFTVTLPFSLSADYEGKTLDDVVSSMSSASYKQAGPWFENSGIPDVFDAVPATEKIYFDNIRFVPLAKPAYSDFPE
ncbi:MAG: glycan-binding surface protein [Prevotellaceae bacterium]|jgi:hypothetical protein|nr:glycan-binding surface protein [Prevotellaceae bacterium]